MDWYKHLQVLARTTGNSRFDFTHDIEVYVFIQDGAWRVLIYRAERFKHGGPAHGRVLNHFLARFKDVELLRMAVGP